MVSLWVGRRGAPTLCAPRSRITPESAADVLVVGQRSGAAPTTPEAANRRAVFPSTLLVIPNVICMCHLPKNRSEAVAPTAPCRVASARCALGATASDRFFGRRHIHITLGITSIVLGEPPLRWSASGLAGRSPFPFNGSARLRIAIGSAWRRHSTQEGENQSL